MRKIALVTCERIPNLTEDDRLLVGPLRRRELAASPAVWSDSSVAWADFDAVVLRSCWDYHLRTAEFLSWLAALEERGVSVWNPSPVVRWNASKLYLADLERAGVAVLPTAFLDARHRVDLERLLEERGWDAAVLKPAVSASAHRTRRISLSTARKDQAELASILENGPALVQPLAAEVASAGEWSFTFFAGRYSHAVTKHPAPGDFRVQREKGGTVRRARPDEALVRQAESLLARAEVPSVYARVDAIERNGALVLMELELIEPELFLSFDSEAPTRFAEAIRGRCDEALAARADARIRLRRAEAEDAGPIALLLAGAFREYERSYTPEAFSATSPPIERVRERLRAGPAWVAVHDGCVVGTLSALRVERGLKLLGMAVASDSRKEGIGRRLLEEAERFARETKSERLVLSTTPFLLPAIRLYERWGFRRSEEGPHDLFGTPLFTMVKALGRSWARPG